MNAQRLEQYRVFAEQELRAMTKYTPTMMSDSMSVVFPLRLSSVRDRSPALAQVPQIEEQRAVPADDASAAAASIPSWNVFKLVLTIIGIMAIGAAAVSIAVLWPGLTLLGFCVALCLMTFTGMPLILASITDEAEQWRSRPAVTPEEEDLLIQHVPVTSHRAPRIRR